MSWDGGDTGEGPAGPSSFPLRGCFLAAHLEEGGVGVDGQVSELQVTLDHLAALVEVPQGLVVALGAGGTQQLHVGAGANCGDSGGAQRVPPSPPLPRRKRRGSGGRPLSPGLLPTASDGFPGSRLPPGQAKLLPLWHRAPLGGHRAAGTAEGWLGTPGAAGPGAGAAGRRNALPTPPGRPRRDKTRLLSGRAHCWGAAGRDSIPEASGRGWGGRREPALGARPRASESRARVAQSPGRPLPAGTAFSGRACLGSSGDAGLPGTAQPRRARGPRRPKTSPGRAPTPEPSPAPTATVLPPQCRCQSHLSRCGASTGQGAHGGQAGARCDGPRLLRG